MNHRIFDHMYHIDQLRQLRRLKSLDRSSRSSSISKKTNIKIRKRNWDEEEKECLINLVGDKILKIQEKLGPQKYNPSQSVALKNAKAEAWAQICQEFQTRFGRERELPEIRKQWTRIKSLARIEYRTYRTESSKAGFRGNPEQYLSIWTMKVRNVIPHEFHLIDNAVGLVTNTELSNVSPPNRLAQSYAVKIEPDVEELTEKAARSSPVGLDLDLDLPEAEPAGAYKEIDPCWYRSDDVSSDEQNMTRSPAKTTTKTTHTTMNTIPPASANDSIDAFPLERNDNVSNEEQNMTRPPAKTTTKTTHTTMNTVIPQASTNDSIDAFPLKRNDNVSNEEQNMTRPPAKTTTNTTHTTMNTVIPQASTNDSIDAFPLERSGEMDDVSNEEQNMTRPPAKTTTKTTHTTMNTVIPQASTNDSIDAFPLERPSPTKRQRTITPSSPSPFSPMAEYPATSSCSSLRMITTLSGYPVMPGLAEVRLEHAKTEHRMRMQFLEEEGQLKMEILRLKKETQLKKLEALKKLSNI